jgi:putative ABC transport system ATP-binding protein
VSDSVYSRGSVELHSISKRYRTPAGRDKAVLRDVSLTIDAGEFTALTGVSGAGKTTLLNLIGGLDCPDAGTIVSGGMRISGLRSAALTRYRRTVGLVFQRCTLLPALTALDNVIAPVLPYAMSWDKRERAMDLLAAVGMAGQENALPAQLSAGEKQRVAIARALINTPALLLADEPTGNLDPGSSDEILRLLASLRIEHAMTVVLASHDPQVAASCERLIRVADGVIADDIQLTGGPSSAEVMRRVGQLG